ncbi:hypothetical protein JCM10212_001182 [Sporobolomyces blumeae]
MPGQSSPPTTTRTLERRVKALKAQEAFVSSWLNRVLLALALLWWVVDGSGIVSTWSRSTSTSKTATNSKSYVGWIGGAIAVMRLGIRVYYIRKRKDLEVELLEREPTGPGPARRTKKPRK